MRQVFAIMEKNQNELLATLCISPLDRRLSQWRSAALHLFEEQWRQAMGRGGNLGVRQIADLYFTCFADVLEKAGIPYKVSS